MSSPQFLRRRLQRSAAGARRHQRLHAPGGVPLDECPVEMTVLRQPHQQTVEQMHIGAGRQRQVQVRELRRGRASRIDGDDLHARTLLARRRQPLQQHGMAPCRVGTHQHHQIRGIQVLITHRNHVLAEGTPVAGDGRGHAQARIGVDVRRADVALHELVGDVVILGQQLARHVERHGLRTVTLDATAEFPRDGGDGLIPRGAHAAQLRIQQAAVEGQRFAECIALHAQLAAIRGMRRIAAHLGALLEPCREHTAADATVGAGGACGGGVQSRGCPLMQPPMCRTATGHESARRPFPR